MLIELFGYLGSVLVVVSMLMSSVIKLRVINTIGSTVSGTYALIIGSFPLALMNGCLIIINVYNLYKLLKYENHYDLVEGAEGDAFLNYVMNHYKEDIKVYFPEFKLGETKFDVAYIICRDTVPAGVSLGRMTDKTTMEIVLDYSTPTYRDCSVGAYLYTALQKKGIKKVSYKGKEERHIPYLHKMGFVQADGEYIKNL